VSFVNEQPEAAQGEFASEGLARCLDASDHACLETVVKGRDRALGGAVVRRVLPAIAKRSVGPFIFFDHFGDAGVPAGAGIQVPPHPHINLATLTYLFEGAVRHRDSLGSDQVIRPGAVNWMAAGRGIVHSERNPDEPLGGLHGVQVWLGLPTEHEEAEPSFEHYPAESIGTTQLPGVSLRVLAGEVYGLSSPVRTRSRLFYVDAQLEAGAVLDLPCGFSERAAYVATGRARARDRAGTSGIRGRELDVSEMAVFSGGGQPQLVALSAARVMLLGGEPLDGPRHMWWNFASSSKQRLADARAEWRAWPAATAEELRFRKVPGDDVDFVPLPGA